MRTLGWILVIAGLAALLGALICSAIWPPYDRWRWLFWTGVALLIIGLVILLLRREEAELKTVHPVSMGGLPFPYEPAIEFVCDPALNLDDVEGRIFALGNAEREKRKLLPYECRPELLAEARAKSAEMAATQSFTLTDLIGQRAVTRVLFRKRRFIVAETLAKLRGYGDPATETISLWLRHRRYQDEILSSSLTISAVGVARCATTGTIYVTQFYGLEGPSKITDPD